MDIQFEIQKIHSQFGTTEMANYQIQKLFDKLILEDRAEQLRKQDVIVQREQLEHMGNENKRQKLNNNDEQLLITAVISSTFFKEHLRKAWSNGRMFDMEQYKNRSVDIDINDVADKALNFEEWFSRHYS